MQKKLAALHREHREIQQEEMEFHGFNPQDLADYEDELARQYGEAYEAHVQGLSPSERGQLEMRRLRTRAERNKEEIERTKAEIEQARLAETLVTLQSRARERRDEELDRFRVRLAWGAAGLAAISASFVRLDEVDITRQAVLVFLVAASALVVVALSHAVATILSTIITALGDKRLMRSSRIARRVEAFLGAVRPVSVAVEAGLVLAGLALLLEPMLGLA